MKLSRSNIDPVLLSAIGILFPIWTVFWLVTNWAWSTFFIVLLTSWFIGIHITMFAHRAWCHRSWQPNLALKWYGLVVFSLCLVGNSIGWVGIHREHHAHSDTDKDPHSPYYKSRWTIQFLSYFNHVKTKYIVDLGRDDHHILFYRWYWLINAIWISILAIIDPVILGYWIAAIGLTVFKLHSVNSLSHRTPWFLLPIHNVESSSNSILLALLNINNGEAWHKNHHQAATNYRFGHAWYEVDPPARIIEILSWCKLANIKHYTKV